MFGTGLGMRYFILKPKSKRPDDAYAYASRKAMETYAEEIDSYNPDLASDLREWIEKEESANKSLNRNCSEKPSQSG